MIVVGFLVGALLIGLWAADTLLFGDDSPGEDRRRSNALAALRRIHRREENL